MHNRYVAISSSTNFYDLSIACVFDRSKRSAEMKSSMSSAQVPIPFADFYGNYYGHDPEHLRIALDALVPSPDNGETKRRSVIFLAGDSSLDNKYWFHDTARAVNGYAIHTS
jgi:hypothetical protein